MKKKGLRTERNPGVHLFSSCDSVKDHEVKIKQCLKHKVYNTSNSIMVLNLKKENALKRNTEMHNGKSNAKRGEH